MSVPDAGSTSVSDAGSTSVPGGAARRSRVQRRHVGPGYGRYVGPGAQRAHRSGRGGRGRSHVSRRVGPGYGRYVGRAQRARRSRGAAGTSVPDTGDTSVPDAGSTSVPGVAARRSRVQRRVRLGYGRYVGPGPGTAGTSVPDAGAHRSRVQRRPSRVRQVRQIPAQRARRSRTQGAHRSRARRAASRSRVQRARPSRVRQVRRSPGELHHLHTHDQHLPQIHHRRPRLRLHHAVRHSSRTASAGPPAGSKNTETVISATSQFGHVCHHQREF